MIIAPPQPNCKIRGYPCNQIDCEFYREWGFVYVEQEKKKWYSNPSDIYAPKWICFGVFGCEYCKHFKGFDLKK